MFGALGDRIGRKRTFMVTMLIMGFSTVAVGLLPTYAQVGVWAPVLLVELYFVVTRKWAFESAEKSGMPS